MSKDVDDHPGLVDGAFPGPSKPLETAVERSKHAEENITGCVVEIDAAQRQLLEVFERGEVRKPGFHVRNQK